MVRRTISDYLGEPAGKPAKAPGRALVPAQAPLAPLVPATTPPDDSAALAAELNDLNGILGELATLVASVSGRVDDQTVALNKLMGTAAETRQAAFAARSQADPGKLASEVGQALDHALLPHLRELTAAVERYGRKTEDQDGALAKLKGQASDLARDLRHARERAALWRARLPGLGAAALVVVLALLALAPRLMADYPVTCLLMGGDWGDYRGWGNGTVCHYENP